MRKNDIIIGSIGHWKCPIDNTDNLIKAGSGNENYTTNNTSCYPLPSKSEGFIMSDSSEKVCKTCKFSLPLDSYHKDKSKKDGYRNTCKSCTVLKVTEYYGKNKEQIALRVAEYREKNKEQLVLRHAEYYKNNKEQFAQKNAEYREKNREQIALKNAEWRENNKGQLSLSKAEYYQSNKNRLIPRAVEYRKDNKERIALKQAEHYRSNKEQIILRRTKYKKNNPEIYRAIDHKRRALKKKVGGSFTSDQINLQDQRQKNKCYYCHKKMGSNSTIEHVIPLSRGGSNDISNIVLACKYCNSSKNAKLPHEWPQGGRLL